MAATITTGLITIKVDDIMRQDEFNFGPFEHGVENAEVPPAIVPGKIPDNEPGGIPEEDRNLIRDDTREKYISFMEDRNLYPFDLNRYDESQPPTQRMRFKAVGINLKTFRINVWHEQAPKLDLTLRFWAISAGKQVEPQVSSFTPGPP